MKASVCIVVASFLFVAACSDPQRAQVGEDSKTVVSAKKPPAPVEKKAEPDEVVKSLVPTGPKATVDPDEAALGTLPEGVGVPVGSKIADFSVLDGEGNQVALKSLVQKGSILLFFYRGGW
jgi:hypothetical protein